MTQRPPTMRSHSYGSPECKRVAILALGWSLVLGGIIGLFLPIVPGGASRSGSFGSIAVCSITTAEVRR
jgi:hypothetical protein